MINQYIDQYKLASLYRKAHRHSTTNSLKLYCQCVANFAMVKAFIAQNESYVATFPFFSLTRTWLMQSCCQSQPREYSTKWQTTHA